MISPIPLAAGCEGKNLQTIQVNSYEVYIKYAEITENTYEYTYPCPSRYKVFLPPLLCVSDATIVSPDPGVCAPSEWDGCELDGDSTPLVEGGVTGDVLGRRVTWDVLCDGAVADALRGGATWESVTWDVLEGATRDVLEGGVAWNVLTDGAAWDVLEGAAWDELWTCATWNALGGGATWDVLWASATRDDLGGSGTWDVLWAGATRDALGGGGIWDVTWGGAARDDLRRRATRDIPTQGGSWDVLGDRVVVWDNAKGFKEEGFLCIERLRCRFDWRLLEGFSLPW